MRHTCEMIGCGVMLLLLGACQMGPQGQLVAELSPEALRVERALTQWPRPAKGTALKRPFFATIHAAGMRTTASGMLEYYGPRDFRVTAVTEMGVILFDGRANWAGVTVMRQMPGLSTGVIETLLTDLTRAFEVPADVEGLKVKDEKLTLERRLADLHRCTWTFNPATGQLVETDVDTGIFDILRVYYRRYTPGGWPEDMQVVRKARAYDVSFTFTDTDVAHNGAAGEGGGRP